jgi:hypothetical protein
VITDELLALQAEYAQAETAPRMGEIQERYRKALAALGWAVPDTCWLPLRCPGRGYCTMFIEGSQTEPCQ